MSTDMEWKTSATYMYGATDTCHIIASCITDPLRGEPIGHGWISVKRANMWRFCVDYTLSLSRILNQQSSCTLIVHTMTLIWCHIKVLIYYRHDKSDKTMYCHLKFRFLWCCPDYEQRPGTCDFTKKCYFKGIRKWENHNTYILLQAKYLWSNETIHAPSFHFPTWKPTTEKVGIIHTDVLFTNISVWWSSTM